MVQHLITCLDLSITVSISSAWRIAVLGHITSSVQLSICLIVDTEGRTWHMLVMGICIRTGTYRIALSQLYTLNSQSQVFSWLLELENVFGPSDLTVACGFILYQFVIPFMDPFTLLAFNTSSGNRFNKINACNDLSPSISLFVCFKSAVSQFHWACPAPCNMRSSE